MTEADELKLTAHHEAAHFIVHASIGFPFLPQITARSSLEVGPGEIEAKIGSGETPALGRYFGGEMFDFLEECWVLLAGNCAEALCAPDTFEPIDFWGSPDDQGARRAMTYLVGEAQTERELETQWRYVRALVRRRWRYVERVAAALLSSQQRTLYENDLRAFRPPAMLPRRYVLERERLCQKMEVRDAA